MNYSPCKGLQVHLFRDLFARGKRKEGGGKYLNLKSPRFKFSRCQNISIAIIAGCIFCLTFAFFNYPEFLPHNIRVPNYNFKCSITDRST